MKTKKADDIKDIIADLCLSVLRPNQQLSFGDVFSENDLAGKIINKDMLSLLCECMFRYMQATNVRDIKGNTNIVWFISDPSIVLFNSL